MEDLGHIHRSVCCIQHTDLSILYTAYRPVHTVYSIQTCPHCIQHTDLSILYTAYRPVHIVYSIQTSPYCIQHTDLSTLYTAYSHHAVQQQRALNHFTHKHFDKRECLCEVGMVEKFLQGNNAAHS